jgi:hypothetical protein
MVRLTLGDSHNRACGSFGGRPENPSRSQQAAIPSRLPIQPSFRINDPVLV